MRETGSEDAKCNGSLSGVHSSSLQASVDVKLNSCQNSGRENISPSRLI